MARDRKSAREAQRREAAEAQAAAHYKEARGWWIRGVFVLPFLLLSLKLLPISFAIGLAIVLVGCLGQGLRVAFRGTQLLEALKQADGGDPAKP